MDTFEIIHSRYLLSLMDGTTTDELRTSLLNSDETYGKDDIFSQVIACFATLMTKHDLETDYVINRIKVEYDALNMQEVMGEFSLYEDFFRLCLDETKKREPCLDTAYAIGYNIDNYCDAIKYGAGSTLLRYLVFARRVTSEFEFAKKIIDLVDSYEQQPDGYLSVRTLCEIAVNTK